MSAWELPESLEVGGAELHIRSDFRAVLDLISVLSDPDLDDISRAMVALAVFYVDDVDPACYREASEKMLWFVSGGEARQDAPKRKLADWEQDFPIIIGPVNRVLGYEARNAEHVHWWTFLAAYMEVGDCLFAQVVAIRDKKRRGKKLEKHEREFYREHRDLVDFKVVETEAETEILDEWMIGGAEDG